MSNRPTLTTVVKNEILRAVAAGLRAETPKILAANQRDCAGFDPTDRAMYDRLVLDEQKVEAMARAVEEVLAKADPVGQVRSDITRPNGLRVVNRSVPFGTILIIYESRPDVTIEAAVLAFKAGNRILLKGGKEALHSNRALIACWHAAMAEVFAQSAGLERLADRQPALSLPNGPKLYVELLELDRAATQAFLAEPPEPLDLVVPRGGEALIAFAKTHARCAVLVSGRGNNFAYVAPDADWEMAKRVILNAKTSKISACNALDKVLLDTGLGDLPALAQDLVTELETAGVIALLDQTLANLLNRPQVLAKADHWDEEFLAMRIAIGVVEDQSSAVAFINRHSGGHSAMILTRDAVAAEVFMLNVDVAAAYHNASTRFTDGGELGAGAELAISTDKLHHRGPLGLEHLVTNRYFVYGDGQVRG